MREPECYSFRPRTPFNKLSKEDKAIANWNSRFYHRLPYDKGFGGLPQDEVMNIIQRWYNKNATVAKPYVAVMNLGMVKILQLAEIPYVLCSPGEGKYFPSTRDLLSLGRQLTRDFPLIKCELHRPNRKSNELPVCAKEKAMYIWLFLQDIAMPTIFGIEPDIQEVTQSFRSLSLCGNHSQASFNSTIL